MKLLPIPIFFVPVKTIIDTTTICHAFSWINAENSARLDNTIIIYNKYDFIRQITHPFQAVHFHTYFSGCVCVSGGGGGGGAT